MIYFCLYCPRVYLLRKDITMTDITIEGTLYSIPDTLEIDPALIIDEENKMLRVSIGKPDLQQEEKYLYDKLFCALKPLIKQPFTNMISFAVGQKVLHFEIAYVEGIERPYGHFYDIETTLNEYTYESIEKPIKELKKKNNDYKTSKMPCSKA